MLNIHYHLTEGVAKVSEDTSLYFQINDLIK